MTVKEVLELYDNWNTHVVVNDMNFCRIAYGTGLETYHNKAVNGLIVKSFGFYDNEFCIRVNKIFGE